MDGELKLVSSIAVRKSREALRDLDRRAEASRREYLASAPAGTTIPARKAFYDDKARKAAQAALEKTRAEIQLELTNVTKRISDHRADPPTDEAVRLVSLLRGRKNVDADELMAADRRFGSNYAVRRALAEIAEDHKMHGLIPKPEADENAQRERAIRGLIDGLTVERYEAGQLTAGSIGFQGLLMGVEQET